MTSRLELHEISKSFGANRVLDDINLTVEPGEFLSLVGPSGCGKSTLLRVIAGLEYQDRGSVLIDRVVVDAQGPRARNIAMVFQNYALYPHMSAFDNIAVPLAVSRLSVVERVPVLKHLSPRRREIVRGIRDDVEAVAQQLQISPLLSRKPGQLSGGQRQRVAVARAMVRKPSVFLMDEPLSNLDAQLRVHMRDELAALHARLGATIVYVTHDQTEAMTMSNRIALLDRGRVAQIGRPQDLYYTPASLTVARFIGTPSINILPSTVGVGGRLMLFGEPLGLKCDLPVGSAVSLGIRPEALQVVSKAKSHLGVARIRRIENHGPEMHVFLHVQSPGTPGVISRISGGASEASVVAPGQDVGLSIDLDQLHVFSETGHRVEAVRLPVGMGQEYRLGTTSMVSA